MRSVLFFLLLPTIALAQSSTPRPEDLGTVTGHIICADTQRPARLAKVTLLSTKPIRSFGGSSPVQRTGTYVPTYTDFSGGYTITNVDPGEYYLRVELDGYVTPFAQFTAVELNSPSPEVQRRMQRELQLVTVAPNSTVQADATIRRGGSIYGTIRYDDGSPAIGVRVEALRHDPHKDLNGIQTFRIGNTDSRGRFEIESLSPGEYVIQATLSAVEHGIVKRFFGDGRSENVVAQLASISFPIYSGSVFPYSDADIIKVDAGEQATGVDITIPISQFHELSGTIRAKDGHPINSGQVALYFADAEGKLTDVAVHDDGTFRFAFVPEGNYILGVGFARDKATVDAPDSPGGAAVRTLRTYGDLEQPLTVQTNIQSLILTVPDKPATTASAQPATP